PAAVIGACYVVAGSLLGSRVLRPLLARAFALAHARSPGLDYHDGADQVAAAWPGVRSAIDRLDPRWDPQLVLDGALRMFDGIGEVYAAASQP
ncbi:MAG: hypothetical protein H0W72_02120, partial [Planctomycetes bacterium]|nr:hypothetical protein [Planctomycetota bacterium]